MFKKKSLCLIGAALALGVSAPSAFAAANPFSDVPADHWAYDAVAQLAADGIIEGYGDSTYRGDRQITRYEMAQMVARAMAKNPQGVDKSLVDRLAAEFGDELNSLGVRVANLERNADKVAWHGELRYTYSSKRVGESRTNRDELRLRLDPRAEVNDHWSVHARLDADVEMSDDSSGNVTLKRAYAQGKYGNLQMRFGKMSAQTFYDNMMMFADEFSGAEVVFGKDLKAKIRAGRINLGNFGAYATASGVGAGQKDSAASMQSLELNYTKKGFNGVLAAYRFSSDAFRDNGATAKRNYRYSYGGDEDQALIWEAAASYRFDRNWKLLGAYARNTKADYQNKAWIAQLEYKGAQPENPGTWGLYTAYRYLGGNTAMDTLPDGCGLGQKGWEVGGHVTLAKNVQAHAIYFFNGRRIVDDEKASKLWGRLEYWF